MLSKATLVFSNVPGPVKGLKYKNVHVTDFIALVPGMGDLTFGITGISMSGNLYMAVQSDTSQVENPKEFKAIIENIYDKLVKEVE